VAARETRVIRTLCLIALLVSTGHAFAQTTNAPGDSLSSPRTVTYCDISKDPAAYNHELVRLIAFVTHGFEDFHLAEPDCHTPGFSLWVMYGGKVQSNTPYCCPGEGGGATRSEPLDVDGLQIPLVNDSRFKGFSDLLKQEPDTTVRATLVGRFFSGKKENINGQTTWVGSGHLGCCSLFVVQKVEGFEAHTRKDLDYTAEAGWYEKEGCKFSTLRDQRHVSVSFPNDATLQAIEAQRRADRGEATWVFTDPLRVALDSLQEDYPGDVPQLRKVKKTPSRQVFRWKKGKAQILVVVSRPYWLSLYANSDSVAWVSTMIKEAGCS
jgi:hypothetical protein